MGPDAKAGPGDNLCIDVRLLAILEGTMRLEFTS